MQVLSLVNLEASIRQKIVKEFKNVSFSFLTSINEAEEELKNADIIITYGEELEKNHIVKATRLKWIMVFTSGIDQLPCEIINERGIIVTNVKGIHKIPMAEYTLLHLLQIVRQNKLLMDNEKSKLWNKMNLLTEIDELNEKNIAIIGAGEIGQEIARIAKAFRMKTYGVNRSGQPVQWFDKMYQSHQVLEFLEEIDFVVSILPSTTNTKYFWKDKHFKKMKKTAVFMNIGRGDTVKENDLLSAILNKDIKLGVLDVFEQEPLDLSHPFWKVENIIVTPHIAGVSKYYHQRAIEIFKQNLRTFLKGEDRYVNEVNLKNIVNEVESELDGK